MRISNLIVFVFTFFFSSVIAQPAKKGADSSVIFSLIDKAELFFTNENYDSALFYSSKAEGLSKQLDFKKGYAYSLIKAAEIYIDKDDLDKADVNATIINRTGIQLKDSLITAIGWMQMGQVKLYKNQFDEAISFLSKSLQYYLERHPTTYTALAFNDLGYCWGIKGELSKKANCILQSISIYEKYFPEEYGELGVAFNNLSVVYYELKQMPEAIDYAKKSLVYREKAGDIARLSLGCCNISQFYTGNNNEEADKYLKLCVKYALQSNQEARVLHSYVTASRLYAINKKPEEALRYELKAIALLEKSGKDPIMLGHRYLAAGILCSKLNKDTSEVKSYFNKSLNLIKTGQNKVNLRDYYFEMAKYNFDNKNFEEAYENYKKHILYRDSIITDKTKTSIAEITTRYETEKKDKEINRLNTEQRIRNLEIEKQKAIINGNMALARQKQNEIDLLSKSRELQDARIKAQEEELVKKELIATANQQQLELAEKEKQLQERKINNQRNLRNLLLAGLGLVLLLGYTYFNRYQLKKKLEQQNSLLAMRNNISQDLHDDIGASLSCINILNELARRNISQPEKSNEYLSKASEDIQRISESLSDIVWNINPKYDDLQNLFVRMKRYAADMFDGKNINGQFDFPADDAELSLIMTQRRDLYLIFKEAVNNLVKYSGAGTAYIQVWSSDKKIGLLVKDDGKGFDISNTKTGNGLKNMEQRAKTAGGQLSIVSIPGTGTTVRLEVKIS